MPVGDGHTALSLVGIVVDRFQEGIEVVGIAGEAGRPQYPVGFCVGLAAVEGKTVLLLLGLVVCNLVQCYRGVEDIESEQTIPHKVVLLTPCA